MNALSQFWSNLPSDQFLHWSTLHLLWPGILAFIGFLLIQLVLWAFSLKHYEFDKNDLQWQNSSH